MSMESLFPELPRVPPPPALPPGFIYERNFISADEEAELLAGIGELALRNSQWHEYTALRRTAAFGLRWSYDGEVLKEAPPAPDFLVRLAAKVAARFALPEDAFPHALVTQYPPGAPIGWHRDAPPFAAIYGVSLASDASFRLRPYEKQFWTKEHTIKLNAERRSLYVMSGDARSRWQHSLPPVKELRYSITLRTLAPCPEGSVPRPQSLSIEG